MAIGCLPNIPAQLYLNSVKELKGCPIIVRTDCGTENGMLAAMQCYFRSDVLQGKGPTSMVHQPETRGLKIFGLI